MVNLLLASKSPRRRELLAQIGVQWLTIDIQVNECRVASESTCEYVKRLACEKAEAGWRQQLQSGEQRLPVLGSDTVVVVDDQLLEKPKDQLDARRMLQLLSGRQHQVLTAVAVCGERVKAEFETLVLVSSSQVFFRQLNSQEIDQYWHTKEQIDNAGGYGVQGLGAVFIERIEGSYSGVMGLPLCETEQLLSHFKVPCWQL